VPYFALLKLAMLSSALKEPQSPHLFHFLQLIEMQAELPYQLSIALDTDDEPAFAARARLARLA